MATVTASTPASAAPPAALFSRLRWMFIFTVVGGLAAAAWDGWYHTQNVFDGFFSPPHVMAYGVALVLAWFTGDLLVRRDLRRWLGVGFRVPTLPFPVPGALVVLGAGVVMLGFSGLVLDNFWHTWFGLNETGWSLPHAMIGWSLLMVVLGFAACRLALGEPGRLWKFVLAWLIVIMATGSVLGPIGRNNSPEMVRAESQIPVYLAQPETQHLFRIYQAHNLNRTNPLLIVLAPLGAAAGLAFVRRMSAGPWLMLGVALLVSLSSDRNTAERLVTYAPGLLSNPANYAALPMIWLAGTYALARRLRASETLAWALGGIAFGLLLHWTFGTQPGMEVLALAGGLTAVIGARIGTRVYDIIRQPDSWRVVAPLIALAIILPLVTGAVDLALRLSTP
ncbi:MAG: hypothetical protein KME04_19355 [Pleurocapsa minor GSE-CHR-MK-17-07R]|jgi:hypothetical protein|nr:hypothetical protein [Pleurocapsa minor GSE-CHR-MK 17-07R]